MTTPTGLTLFVLASRNRWINALNLLGEKPLSFDGDGLRGQVKTRYDEPGHPYGQWSARLRWAGEQPWNSADEAWLLECSFLALPPREIQTISEPLDFFIGFTYMGPLLVGTSPETDAEMEAGATKNDAHDEIRGRVNTLYVARRLMSEATSVVSNLEGLNSILYDLDYSMGDPPELEVLKKQLPKLMEVETAILALHLRKAQQWKKKT